MNQEIQDIIKQSSFTVEPGSYIYAKVSEFPNTEDHFMITKDREEITVVTTTENVSSLKLIERNKDNYSLIALNVSIPFYSVGFLATVSKAIAEGGMNILIVSTYSKDYIMVREDKLPEAIKVLLDLGFNQN